MKFVFLFNFKFPLTRKTCKYPQTPLKMKGHNLPLPSKSKYRSSPQNLSKIKVKIKVYIYIILEILIKIRGKVDDLLLQIEKKPRCAKKSSDSEASMKPAKQTHS